MEKTNVTKRVTATILSMSLLTVMAGAAIAPALGIIKAHFLQCPPEQQAQLMGLSAAMNQMGGVVATLLAGLLATIEWNYAFLVYLMGLIAVVMVWLWLPNEQLGSANKRGIPFEPRQLLKFHPSVIGMLLLMMIFFVFPTNFAIIAHQQTSFSNEAITMIMVGLDVVAFFVGLVFGPLMHWFRQPVKYFAPLFFLLGYAVYLVPSVTMILLGSVFIGIANGVGVPYLNTIASIKGGKNSATTVMPLLSAALYLGQFVSPLVVIPLSHNLFGADLTAPYKVAILLCLVFLVQVWATRHFQSLPPK